MMSFKSVFAEFDELDREIINIKNESDKNKVIIKLYKLLEISENRIGYLRAISHDKYIKKYERCCDKLLLKIRELNDIPFT